VQIGMKLLLACSWVGYVPIFGSRDCLIKYTDETPSHIFRRMWTWRQHAIRECVHNTGFQLSIAVALFSIP